MYQTSLLLVTAFVETGAGLLLLFLPSVALQLLLGVSLTVPEELVVARIAGAALLSIGVANGLSRGDKDSAALTGLITGALVYNGTVAAILGWAGLSLDKVGAVLWPAVLLHTLLAAWCFVCVWKKFPAGF